MEKIRPLFLAMSSAEKRNLKSYLTAFYQSKDNKASQFLSLLEKDPFLTQDELSKRLYKDPQSKAFLMMKGRLYERMLEVLALNISLQSRQSNYKNDPAVFEAIMIEKQFMQAILLRRRGLNAQAKELLEKCIQSADSFGLPELKLKALVSFRNFSVSEPKAFHHLCEEINQATEAYKTDLMAVGKYDEYRVMFSGSLAQSEHEEIYLRKTIAILNARVALYPSPRAQYYSKYLQFQHHIQSNNEHASRNDLKELVELVNSEKGLYRKNRLGVLHFHLCFAELKFMNFGEAYEASKNAMEMLEPNTNNYLTALSYGLYACIYNQNWEAFSSIFRNALSSQKPAHTQGHKRREIIQYLASCASFLQGDVSLALEHLRQISILYQDKVGWNTFLRLYEIILLIETEALELAEARIESFRKHCKRYPVSKRFQLIHKFLGQLYRRSFDFKQLLPEVEASCKQLAKEAPWEWISGEIVQFESWIGTKISDQTFAALLDEEFMKLRTLGETA